jgi:hypothetical protein
MVAAPELVVLLGYGFLGLIWTSTCGVQPCYGGFVGKGDRRVIWMKWAGVLLPRMLGVSPPPSSKPSKLHCGNAIVLSKGRLAAHILTKSGFCDTMLINLLSA